MDIVHQFTLVLRGNGNDVVHADVTEYASFNLNLLLIGFPLDFVAGFQFMTVHHVHGFEHLDACFVEVTVENNGA